MHNFSGFKPEETNECCCFAMWKPAINRKKKQTKTKQQPTTNVTANIDVIVDVWTGLFSVYLLHINTYISLAYVWNWTWGLLLIASPYPTFLFLSPFNRQTMVSCTFQTVKFVLVFFFLHTSNSANGPQPHRATSRALQIVAAADENLCRLEHWGTEGPWLHIKSEAKAAARQYFYLLPGSQSRPSPCKELKSALLTEPIRHGLPESITVFSFTWQPPRDWWWP